MIHQISRIRHDISEHLDPLCVQQRDVVILTFAFHKMLMIQLAGTSPFLIRVHEQHMSTVHDQILCNIRGRSAAVVRGSLINQLFNHVRRVEHNGSGVTYLQ